MQGLRRTLGTNPQKPHYLVGRWIQTDTWRHGYSIEKRFLQINIYRFTDFRNSGNIHSKGDSCTFMDIEMKIQHDRSSATQIFKQWKFPINKHPVPGTSPSAIKKAVSERTLCCENPINTEHILDVGEIVYERKRTSSSVHVSNIKYFLVGKSLLVLIFCKMSLIFVRESVMRKFRDFKNGILQWLSQTGMPGSLCSIYNDAFPALLGLFGMNEVNNSPPEKNRLK